MISSSMPGNKKFYNLYICAGFKGKNVILAGFWHIYGKWSYLWSFVFYPKLQFQFR